MTNFEQPDTDWGPLSTGFADMSVSESLASTFDQQGLNYWLDVALEEHGRDPGERTLSDRFATTRIEHALRNCTTICTSVNHVELDDQSYDRLTGLMKEHPTTNLRALADENNISGVSKTIRAIGEETPDPFYVSRGLCPRPPEAQ
jgi:hypothetical protein